MYLHPENPWAEPEEGVHLQMVGVCLKNAVGSGLGPKLTYVEPEDLKEVKISHAEVEGVLQTIVGLPEVREAFIWNTCNRFEVYFFHTGKGHELVEEVLNLLFKGIRNPSEKVNRLSDREAIHHLLRTTIGFNSGLPGEKDVSMQLHSAVRHAEVVGTTGEHTESLTRSVFEFAQEIRTETEWSRYSPSYCQAALEEALRGVDLGEIPPGTVAVIGSSNTSRSCVEVLRRHFGISEEDVTIYHRCHHKDGQMKAIRRAARGSARVRVPDYDDETVHEAIANSRLVIVGIDRDRPVISGEKLKKYLTGKGPEVVLIDFNTFGSCEGMTELEGIRVIEAARIEELVRAYAERMVQAAEFQATLEEVEPMVRDRSGVLSSTLGIGSGETEKTQAAGNAKVSFAMEAL